MGTISWDTEGCILIEFLETGKTINAARYVQTLLKLRCALQDKGPGRKVILQHDNTWPHTAHLTLEKIENMGGEFLYSRVLTPYDYHLFGFVKNQMQGQHYKTNEALQTAVRQCLRASWNRALLQGNIQTFRTVGKMCTEKRELRRKIRCLWLKMMYLVLI